MKEIKRGQVYTVEVYINRANKACSDYPCVILSNMNTNVQYISVLPIVTHPVVNGKNYKLSNGKFLYPAAYTVSIKNIKEYCTTLTKEDMEIVGEYCKDTFGI